jgi:uncharacterized damage-inducible protein DinB
MNLESISLLYAHNIWANDQVMGAAAGLSPEQFTRSVPWLPQAGSLRSVLVHVYGAEWTWRSRCMLGISPAALPEASEFPTIESLYERWREESETMRYYIAGLTSARLFDPVSYKNTRGQSFQEPLWQILSHVVLHGMQHRSEAALVLTSYGRSPGDIDLIRYVRQQG